jgi:diguanylate cyclase (GGDEF)-like protein
MKARVSSKALFAMALACLWSMAAHASGFGDVLAHADALRSSDPQEFSRRLDSLSNRLHEASAQELRHYRLLSNYRRVIRGEYEAAVGDAAALIEQAPEAELRYRAALLVANTSALNRDYVFGLRYLDRALALRGELQEPALRHMGDAVAGTLFNEFGHFDRALEQVERLLADDPAPRMRCFARQIRARALHGLGKAIDEDRDVHEAIADCAAQGETMAVSAIRGTLAEYLASRGRTRQAVALLEATLPEARETGYTRLIAEIQSLLARYHLALGDVGRAEAHATAVVSMKGRDPLSLASVTAQHVLYQAALARGDAQAALRHYREYAEADKRRMDDVKSREYAYQLTRHELNQKNQSIQLLSNQNQVLRLQQEVARRSAWNFRLMIALLVVLIVSISYWGWRGRRMHRSLRQLAETDGLTGLSNRRHFRAMTERALALSGQRGRPVSLLLFDLDQFKQINDQCGHSAGDWVLREVARVGRMHCREGDLFGRIGGEEFAMALIDCDTDAALRIAEACRQSIQSIDPAPSGCSLAIAASIGCVGTRQSGYDYEVLIAHADAAMYRAKLAGRNRVSLYVPLAPEAESTPRSGGDHAGAVSREY